jgi:hypothetical protein
MWHFGYLLFNFTGNIVINAISLLMRKMGFESDFKAPNLPPSENKSHRLWFNIRKSQIWLSSSIESNSLKEG